MIGDLAHGAAQRPAQTLVANSKHVEQSLLPVHAYQRRLVRIDFTLDQRHVNGAQHMVLEADHLECTEGSIDIEFCDRLDGLLFR